jgi:hypothetical protein
MEFEQPKSRDLPRQAPESSLESIDVLIIDVNTSIMGHLTKTKKKDPSAFLVVYSYMTRSQVVKLVFFGIKVADRPPENGTRHKSKDTHHAVVPYK